LARRKIGRGLVAFLQKNLAEKKIVVGVTARPHFNFQPIPEFQQGGLGEDFPPFFSFCTLPEFPPVLEVVNSA
jgi:hypothetical protein